MAYMLGRLPKKEDDRTLQLRKYLTPVRPTPPANLTWYPKNKVIPMYLNDKIGCCGVSSMAHLIGVWTANAINNELVFDDSAVREAYSGITGSEGAAYDPATGANDNGVAMLDALNYYHRVGLGGRKNVGFVEVNAKSQLDVQLACWWYGGLYCGFDLPAAVEPTFSTSAPWTLGDKPPTGAWTPGSLGGHAVEISSYSPRGVTCTTWDMYKSMDWNFFHTYCTECYAVFSLDWVYMNEAPNGINNQQLLRDLASFN
jgi:hypothetical protein